MSSLAIAVAILVCATGAALLGFFLNTALPGHHTNADSRASLTTTINVLGMLMALVFGMLLATAKTSYETKFDGINQVTTDVILLDQALAQYGPDASQVRTLLREMAMRRLKALWSESGLRQPVAGGGEVTATLGSVGRGLRELNPANEQQRKIQTQALELIGHLARTQLLTLAQAGGSIPNAFLIVLVSWMIILFVGMGILTPRNATARIGVIACVFTFSTVLFLVLELDTPYGGVIQISDAPLDLVLEQLGK